MDQEGPPREEIVPIQNNYDWLIEQFSLTDTQITAITDTVLLLSGYSHDGKEAKLILKKSQNESPLLSNAENREEYFYKHLKGHLKIAVPSYVGNVEGHEVFSFVEGERANPSIEEVVSIIRNIQDTDIEPSQELLLKGEYSDIKQVVDFSQNLTSDLSQISVSIELQQATKKLIELLPEILETLNQRPQFLTHGDFWRDNLIVNSSGVTVLDWENVQLNNDHYDMATYCYTEAFMQNNPNIHSENNKLIELGFEPNILEYNFMVQTLSQLIPVIIQKGGTALHDWQLAWLEHYRQVIDKHIKS